MTDFNFVSEESMVANQKLRGKVNAEYTAFLDVLKEMPAEEIINRAYETVIKERITDSISNIEYEPNEADALRGKDNTLDFCYREWDENSCNSDALTDSIYDSIDQCINQVMGEEQGFNIKDGVLISCVDETIEHAEIPDSVWKICDQAFCGCSDLKTVKIPDTVEEIGVCAFASCHSLESVEIAEGVTRIDFGAFQYCDNLKSVTIPDSIREIDEYAFAYCENLSNLQMSPQQANRLLYLNDAFYNAQPALDKIQELRGNDFEIVDGVLEDCNNMRIKHAVVPDNVWKIGIGAFDSCYWLESIELPEGLDHIAQNAFRNCRSLNNVTIPDSVHDIGSYAFAGCTNLSNVSMSDRLLRHTEIEYEFRDTPFLEMWQNGDGDNLNNGRGR